MPALLGPYVAENPSAWQSPIRPRIERLIRGGSFSSFFGRGVYEHEIDSGPIVACSVRRTCRGRRLAAQGDRWKHDSGLWNVDHVVRWGGASPRVYDTSHKWKSRDQRQWAGLGEPATRFLYRDPSATIHYTSELYADGTRERIRPLWRSYGLRYREGMVRGLPRRRRA